MDLAELAYRATGKWPTTHRYGLSAQLQRAAASVPANIAEGFERRSRKEYLRFLAIAGGSLAEVETHVMLAVRIGLGDENELGHMLALAREIARILRGIERGLKRNLGPGP